MAKKPTSTEPEPSTSRLLENRPKSHTIINHAAIAQANTVDVELRKMRDITDLLWLPSSQTQAQRDACIVRAMDLFESINPIDGLEAMLALQMVGTHHAAMECLRRAMLVNQTVEGRNMALSQAQRLMALYTTQLTALDKHRGKGQQQVTVKHVHVGAGGQAILGNVNTAAAASADAAAHPQPDAAQAALPAPVEAILPPVISTMQRARVPRP